jgi:hypothetical protein
MKSQNHEVVVENGRKEERNGSETDWMKRYDLKWYLIAQKAQDNMSRIRLFLVLGLQCFTSMSVGWSVACSLSVSLCLCWWWRPFSLPHVVQLWTSTIYIVRRIVLNQVMIVLPMTIFIFTWFFEERIIFLFPCFYNLFDSLWRYHRITVLKIFNFSNSKSVWLTLKFPRL